LADDETEQEEIEKLYQTAVSCCFALLLTTEIPPSDKNEIISIKSFYNSLFLYDL